MNKQVLKAYVEKADDSIIRIRVIDPGLVASLGLLGFTRKAECFVTEVADDLEKAAIFDALRLLEIPFSDGREWCPAEVFEYLRDKGLVGGDFIRVAWTGSGRFRLDSVPET